MMLSDERMLQLDPRLDEVTHINIYSRGKTRLGRLVTNLADVPVQHPVYGRFRTGEGLWYYLKTGMCHEELRSMSGFEAKAHGKQLPNKWNDNFQEEFKEAIVWKIENHPELKQLMVESTLPFEHYYYYVSKKEFSAEVLQGMTQLEQVKAMYNTVEPKDVRWLTEFITEQRTRLQAAR